MKIGRRTYDLYDVSGYDVIQRDKHYLEGLGYSTHVVKGTGKKPGWYSIYCYPKFKNKRKVRK